MNQLEANLQKAGTIVILGHVRPDGDCTSSCLAMWNYIRENYPGKQVEIHLEKPLEKFSYLSGFETISQEIHDTPYDLCICMDCSDRERLGDFGIFLCLAKQNLCIDHHVTNMGYAQENVIDAKASSTCEVLFGRLTWRRSALRRQPVFIPGLVHDTGVFKYSNTSARTMKIAAQLMEKGIDFGFIIDHSFYKKTYCQNQILGRALLESIKFLQGTCIFSVVRSQDMEFFRCGKQNLDGIVEQLRVIEGIECAIFLHETGNHVYKVSMRSNRDRGCEQNRQLFWRRRAYKGSRLARCPEAV